jgi:glycosyltransferase involved in cell wall biosynthesis
MISFIVPAHNEQACLGRTLQAIHESARTAGQPYEIVVANDASADATEEIAKENKAPVVNVNCRQIAGARNAGARAANGGRLFFVDADTIINARIVTSALHRMDKGAVGGGAPARFDSAAPLYAQL